MTRKTLFPIAAFALSFVGTAQSSITLNYQFIAPELTPGTRCLLVASTRDADFGDAAHLAGLPLRVGCRFGGDEMVLAVFEAGELGGGLSGCAGALHVDYRGALDAGDPLRLIWLPDLAADASVVPLGTRFATYRSDLPEDGGTIGFALPANGSTQSIYSIADAYGGSLPSAQDVPAEVIRFDPVADSDRDGISDFTEFAMGLDPFEATSPSLAEIQLVQEGDMWQLSFARRDDFWIHGIDFVVESSADLSAGSWVSVDGVLNDTALGEASDREWLFDFAPEGSRFLRVRIRQP